MALALKNKRVLTFHNEVVNFLYHIVFARWQNVSAILFPETNAVQQGLNMYFSGVNVGDRWRDLYEVSRSLLGQHDTIASDVSIMASCLGAGKLDEARQLMESVKQFLWWGVIISVQNFDWGGGSSIGRVFRLPFWWWWKMAAFPLPVAISDDLIPGTRKWGHPRWRPEAEGPPFSTTTTMGVEKLSPGLGWRHFRRHTLRLEDVGTPMKTSHPQKGVVLVQKTSRRRLKLCFFFSVGIQKSIWSLASPNHSQNGRGSCPLATTGKSISLHVSTPGSMKRGVDLGKHLLYFFLILCFYFF